VLEYVRWVMVRKRDEAAPADRAATESVEEGSHAAQDVADNCHLSRVCQERLK